MPILERFTFFRDGLHSLFAVAWPPPLTPATWCGAAAVRINWKVALVAETEAPPWPDGIDWVLTSGYLALILGLPLLGYLVMYFDFRRYLRSLRRALVFVAHSVQSMPYWALRERPGCLVALDLHLPCTEEDVMAAYRKRVKALHPDRGGDLQKFLRLQKQFEQALHLVRCQTKASATASN